jgi:hypothetical protein
MVMTSYYLCADYPLVFNPHAQVIVLFFISSVLHINLATEVLLQ